MSSQAPNANYYFTRYLHGYHTNVEVVTRLSKSPTAKNELTNLIAMINAQEHWKEKPALTSLHKIAKLTLTSNFDAPVSPHQVVEQPKAGSFLNLNANALGVVAGFLPDFKAIFNMGIACKEANQHIKEMLTKNPKLLSNYLNTLLERKDEATIMRFLGQCHSIYADTPLSLVIRTTWPRFAICLHEIQKKFPTVAKVEIAKKDISDQDFETCLAAFPKPQALDISGCAAINAATLHRAKFPVTLEQLCLSGTQLDDHGLHEICKNDSKLKLINIRDCVSLSLAGIFTVTLPASIECYLTSKDDLSPDEIGQLKRLLETWPNNACLRTMVAISEMSLPKTRQELEAVQNMLEKALSICPRYVDALIGLAMLQLAKAVKGKEPNDKSVLYAKSILQQVSEMYPEMTVISFGLGITLWILREYASAHKQLSKYLAHNPDDSTAPMMLADIYMIGTHEIKKDYKEAERLLKLALQHARDGSVGQFSLALINHNGGFGIESNPAEAKKLMKQFLDGDEELLDDFFLAQELIMASAKFAKFVLEDPAFTSYKPKIIPMFKSLLALDPDNKELKEIILSCAL